MVRVTVRGPELGGVHGRAAGGERPGAPPVVRGCRRSGPELERQRVPPARRATADDPHVHALARRPRGPGARRRDRRPRWRCRVRMGCVGRAGSAGRGPRARAVATPSIGTPPRISSPGTRPRSRPSRRSSTRSPTRRRCRCASRSPMRTAASRCRSIPARPCSGSISHPARLPATRLGAAVRDVDLPDGAAVWAAGEAAAVQRIRRHLFDDRGLARASDVCARLLEARSGR